MSKIPLIYLAHPLAGDIPGNVARTLRWLKWLMENETRAAFVCPWLPFVSVVDDTDVLGRKRCLRDDCAIAARCDGIVLCGDRVSPGMVCELDAVLSAGGFARNLITIDGEPPPVYSRLFGEAPLR